MRPKMGGLKRCDIPFVENSYRLSPAMIRVYEMHLFQCKYQDEATDQFRREALCWRKSVHRRSGNGPHGTTHGLRDQLICDGADRNSGAGFLVYAIVQTASTTAKKMYARNKSTFPRSPLALGLDFESAQHHRSIWILESEGACRCLRTTHLCTNLSSKAAFA